MRELSIQTKVYSRKQSKHQEVKLEENDVSIHTIKQLITTKFLHNCEQKLSKKTRICLYLEEVVPWLG